MEAVLYINKPVYSMICSVESDSICDDSVMRKRRLTHLPAMIDRIHRYHSARAIIVTTTTIKPTTIHTESSPTFRLPNRLPGRLPFLPILKW